MNLFHRLLSTPKRLCRTAQDRAFKRQLREMEARYNAENAQRREAFERELAAMRDKPQ